MKKIINFILKILSYPVTVYRVMKMRKIYNQEKRDAWNLFYAKNKVWLGNWYREKGLDSKPPVYYDQKSKKWIKLNRQQRREMYARLNKKS